MAVPRSPSQDSAETRWMMKADYFIHGRQCILYSYDSYSSNLNTLPSHRTMFELELRVAVWVRGLVRGHS